ncbi:MAG: helix-hairpin-helix domain-containing protein [Halieaceae bacterium]|nr:helix-hairpin-helix domain-containing protein [Halieaceae bacterium]MCP5202741.1 helix-hairpin-helix domain-containing protein [Pseudomonadales bacterium]
MALPALLLALLVTLPLTVGNARAQEAAAAPATVNINEADAETLASALRGIGDARAVEIVRYREAYGPFTSVDELVEVRGIGQSTLDDNRALITLE